MPRISELLLASGQVGALPIVEGGVTKQVDGGVLKRSGSTYGFTAGNVGIGTLTPSALLHVYGSAPKITVQDSNTSTFSASAGLRLAESAAGGAVDNWWDLIVDAASSAFSYSIRNNIAGDVLRITQAGRCSIYFVDAIAGLRELQVGAPDSAGSGFRAVRVAN